MYEDILLWVRISYLPLFFFFLISLHTPGHVCFTLDSIAANIIWQVWLAVGRWGAAGRHCWVDNCSPGAWIDFGKSDRCTLVWLKIAWMCIFPTCRCVDCISKVGEMKPTGSSFASWDPLWFGVSSSTITALLLFLLWGQLTDRSDGQNPPKKITILLVCTGHEVQHVATQGSWLMGQL